MPAVKPLVSLTLLASLALLAPTFSGCGASNGGDTDKTDNPGDDGSGNGGGGDGEKDAGQNPGTAFPLATGLSISGVVLYQSVSVALMWDGAEITKRTAPIVAGKDALVRVMVRPDADWQARQVVARLELHDGDGVVATYQSKLEVTAESKEETLGSTFNFDVPGDQITADLAYSVSLREIDQFAKHPGSAANAQFPKEGVAEIGAKDSRGNFKFTLVPYRYNGRVPDTSEKQLQLFRDKFTSYPTPGVEITVHAPVDHAGTFSASGTGWNQLLDKTCNLRISEKAAKDNYYFGIIVPTATAAQFCGQGCVAGLAPLANQASDNRSRCGIGLGFTDRDMAVETAMHELGHALGREHAPCGLGGQPSDRKFPYPQAGLGVWGWEGPKRRLHSPSKVKDVMSYCQPVWVSDYTYSALFDRISFVNASPLMMLPDGFPDRWRSIVVETDGSLHWGDRIQLDSVPGGTPKTIYLLDENGAQIGEATGFFYGTHHLPGGSVLVAEEHLKGAKAIRMAGRSALSL